MASELINNKILDNLSEKERELAIQILQEYSNEGKSFTFYGYIYKTTNKVNNKIYIGQHKKETFDSNYLGSGYQLRRAVTKYGRDAFKTELLCWAYSKPHLDLLEKYFIKEYNSTDTTIGYNIADGGQGGDLGEAIRQKISNALKGHVTSEETRIKLSNINKGKHLSEDTKRKISIGNMHKVFSDETKLKMSIASKENWKKNPNREGSVKNKKCITNGLDIKYINKNDTLPEDWYFGNCKTAEKHNMSNYYSNTDIQIRNSKSKSGKNNSMYGNGYRVAGGNNGKATKDYWFNDIKFDCRKSLLEYLKTIDNTVSENLIRNIENNSYKKRTLNKYKWVIDSVRWEFKDGK